MFYGANALERDSCTEIVHMKLNKLDPEVIVQLKSMQIRCLGRDLGA